MNRSKIEWTDYTWNPVTGCKRDCSYCYARRIAERFKGTKAWPNGFEPTFHPERLNQPAKCKTPSKIFVCSVADLFGSWIPRSWVHMVFEAIEAAPQHTFQLLTKAPGFLGEYSLPDNTWIGVTAENRKKLNIRKDSLLRHANGGGFRFTSIEPIQDAFAPDEIDGLDWVIVGAQTGPGAPPVNKAQVVSVIDACTVLGIPVFVKSNTGFDGPRQWPGEIK
jgi:protein gp37